MKETIKVNKKHLDELLSFAYDKGFKTGIFVGRLGIPLGLFRLHVSYVLLCILAFIIGYLL